jgi:hypothetical protein
MPINSAAIFHLATLMSLLAKSDCKSTLRAGGFPINIGGLNGSPQHLLAA